MAPWRREAHRGHMAVRGGMAEPVGPIEGQTLSAGTAASCSPPPQRLSPGFCETVALARNPAAPWLGANTNRQRTSPWLLGEHIPGVGYKMCPIFKTGNSEHSEYGGTLALTQASERSDVPNPTQKLVSVKLGGHIDKVVLSSTGWMMRRGWG